MRGPAGLPIRRIIVGVDGSNAAAVAVEWAVEEAGYHNADVRLVHVRTRPAGAVDVAVAGSELIAGDAAEVLTSLSDECDLLVVGSRGRSGFRTMLFGSVMSYVTEHAAGAVAVIPPRVRGA